MGVRGKAVQEPTELPECARGKGRAGQRLIFRRSAFCNLSVGAAAAPARRCAPSGAVSPGARRVRAGGRTARWPESGSQLSTLRPVCGAGMKGF